ncbi:hypothetical protein ACIBO5_56235 [Nonomuraea angiospora]|uniref:hypothetical protein n=1 Tax=Nonomuraea TaxID=83681 RepID=UPI0029A9FABE|nr:hypothetical protein [Nonomuraea angiospora]MDX3101490.1 hypothetical protein [Nonomuraea angiospora]
MTFLPPTAAAEVVVLDAVDVAVLTWVLADHHTAGWSLSPLLAVALRSDGTIVMQGHQLWAFLRVADPEVVYDLVSANDAAFERIDVQAHQRLEAELCRQAPLTAAAMNVVMEAELIVHAAQNGD